MPMIQQAILAALHPELGCTLTCATTLDSGKPRTHVGRRESATRGTLVYRTARSLVGLQRVVCR